MVAQNATAMAALRACDLDNEQRKNVRTGFTHRINTSATRGGPDQQHCFGGGDQHGSSSALGKRRRENRESEVAGLYAHEREEWEWVGSTSGNSIEDRCDGDHSASVARQGGVMRALW
jgi:hypothetical protein